METNIQELIQGISIVIDDEVDNDQSTIYKIVTEIENAFIPVVKFRKIPDKEFIGSFMNASFIILDWNFSNGASQVSNDSGEMSRVLQGDYAGVEITKQLIEFIKKILETTFMPVFIFSTLAPEVIKDTLRSQIQENDLKRIFVKNKQEVSSADKIYDEINKWLKQMPSAYVLKVWSNRIDNARNNMFIDLYKASPSWATIFRNIIKNDSTKKDSNGDDNTHNFELGHFITKNCINRIDDYQFNDEYFSSNHENKSDELKKILEQERFFSYSAEYNNSLGAYTGDLFLIQDDNGKNKYIVNIRAQCDLMRESDPKLYCIEGECLSDKNYVKETEVKIENGHIIFGSCSLPKSTFLECCQKNQSKKACEKVNQLKNKINSQFKSVIVAHGEMRETKTEVIIPCIHEGKIIKFHLKKFEIIDFSSIKNQRIGRILPPYITHIQQKAASFIIRNGFTPIPDDALF